MEEEKWIVGLTEGGTDWTYPGKVKVQNDSFVVFEIEDPEGSFEIHRSPDQVRTATKADFDRQILDISKSMIDAEVIISKLEGIQRNVP